MEDPLSRESIQKAVQAPEERWNRTPTEEELTATVANIEKRGVNVILVKDRKEALETVRAIIPPGSEVMNGSSTTLIEIGFVELLRGGGHGWKNLHEEILKEKDPQKQSDLRRKSVTAEYFLSGVNAIAQTGELVANDQGGNRVGAWPFAAKKLVLVAGVNKIFPTLEQAIERIRQYALPLEIERARRAYGMSSRLGKMVILFHEILPERTTLVLVRERLGF